MERMEQNIKRLIRVAGKRTTAVVLALLMVVSMLPVVWPSVSAADYVCGLEEHTHSEECAEAACEKAEHAHTDGCYPAEEPDSEVTERVEAEKNIPVIPVSGSDAKDAVVSAGDVSGSDVSGSDIDLIEAFPVFAQSAAVDGVVVSVSAPIGVFPAGAELSVSKVSASTQSQVDALIGEADDSYTFDIKVLLDGEEIQPDTAYGEVSVRFSLDVPANTEVEVYHIDDGMTEADAMAPVVGDNSVAVVTDSFSLFTVTFTYNGLTYALDYEIGGANTVKLSEMLTALGISGTPSAAVSGNAAVTAVEDGSGDWDITIAKPFDTAITLTATVDGTDYAIELTSNVAHTDIRGGCSWIIDTNGVLTIFPTNGESGTLSGSSGGWSSYKEEVTSVVVKPGVVGGSNIGYMFSDFKNCTSMDLRCLDTSEVMGMARMFDGCSSLTKLDVSGWDTSKVTTMYGTFNSCESLTSLDLSSWDVSNVTNMNATFDSCKSLTSLDLTGWNPSSVTNMSLMFDGCSALTELDVSGWDASSVTDMNNMFTGCRSLTSLDISSWDTSSVNNMGAMFRNCDALTELDVSGWDTSKVTAMYYMFSNCHALTELDVSGWDTSSVTNMMDMFSRCRSLTSLDLSSWDTSSLTNMMDMFYYCGKLAALDISGFDTSNVTSMDAIFEGCFNLNQLTVRASWDPADDYERASGVNFFNVVDGSLVYTPQSNYAIKSLTIDGEEVEFDLLGGTYPNFTGDMIATIVYGKAKIVTFMDNGTKVDEQTVAEGGDAKDPYADESKIIGVLGKHFAGWDKAITNIQTYLTVYAQYEFNDYVLVFDANGGEGDMAPVAFKYGTAQNLPKNAFTREGHTFTQWNTKADGSGDAYADKASVYNLTEEHDVTVTFYAQWEINQYTVTFKDSTDNSTIGEVTVDYNTAATAPAAPTHEDLEFVRWATEKNGETEADLTAVTEDITVWAVYKEPRDSITGAPSVVFDKASKTFTTKEEIKFKAVGFWADSTTTDFVDGDERYVPLNWHHADPSGDFGGKTAPTDTYTGSFKQSSAGTYTLKVEFRKYVYEDGAWVDKGIVTVDTQYKVTAPSGGSTIVPDTGDHGVSGTVALYVMQIAILSALLCVFSAKKLRKTGEAE